jgi:hypothetical protein
MASLEAVGVVRAVPMTLRNGENIGGYGGFDPPTGSGLARCCAAFQNREAQLAPRGWVRFPDVPEHIAFEVAFLRPEVMNVRFIFGLPEQRDCLQAVADAQMLTLAPTGGNLPIDPEAGFFFEGIDVSDLNDFL